MQISNNRFLIISTLLFLGVFSLFLDQIPGIAIDEAWFAFYAAQEWGMNLFPELRSEIQYKLFFLYPMISAAFFKLFGVSLMSIRAIAVISGAIGLLGIQKLTFKATSSKALVMLASILYVTSNITLVTSRWGRPEGLVFSALIWVLYFLYIGFTEKKASAFSWAGALSAIMVLLHPFSGVSVLPICIVVVCYNWQSPKYIWAFFRGALPFAAAFLVNMFYFSWEYTSAYLLDHIGARLTLTNAKKPFIDRVIYFWESYTLGVKRLYILLFEIGILIYGLFQSKDRRDIRIFSFVGLGTFILGLVLLSPFRRRYFGIVMMISIVLVPLILHRFLSKRRTTHIMCAPFIIAIAVYLSNNIAGDLFYLYKQSKNMPYHILAEHISNAIPKDATVVSYVEFWFPLRHQFTVTQINDYPIKGFESVDTLLQSTTISHVVTSDFMLVNYSPTTGEKAIGYNFSEHPFVNAIHTHVKPSWVLDTQFDAPPFGQIQIYRNPHFRQVP